MKTSKINLRDIALCAMFAAVMTVCAWISIPVLEIAFTLQTFAVCVALGLLGGKRGTISILVYLLLGLVGLPVFSGFGSTSSLVGVTGGYLVGFLFSGLVYWLITKLLGEKLWAQLVGMIVGLVVCYAFGSVWFYILYLNGGNAITFATVLAKCVIPFLIPDGVKIALALLLTWRLKKYVPA